MSFATTSDGVRLFYESAGSGTPIIFVTSLVSKSEAGRYNGKRFMSKPIDPNLLLQTVREVLDPAAV